MNAAGRMPLPAAAKGLRLGTCEEAWAERHDRLSRVSLSVIMALWSGKNHLSVAFCRNAWQGAAIDTRRSMRRDARYAHREAGGGRMQKRMACVSMGGGVKEL